MNKHEVFAHYSMILDDLLDNYAFFNYFLQSPCYIDDIEGEYEDSMPDNISMRFGVTRACLIDSDFPWVVKFDIEEDMRGSACEREVDIYTNAKQRGLESYFAEVQYLGNYERTVTFYDAYMVDRVVNWTSVDTFEHNFDEHCDELGTPYSVVISIPLYGYPYAEPHSSALLTPDEKTSYQTTVKHISSPLYERNLGVAIEFVRIYGEDAYSELSDFLYEYDVNDIHCGNVGDIDGNYCMIDYAGFHDTFSIDA